MKFINVNKKLIQIKKKKIIIVWDTKRKKVIKNWLCNIGANLEKSR